MKTRCLIVDDEPLALEIVESYLAQLEDFEVVATCKNALQAFKVLEEEQVDLLFLDIQMPRLTGIDFLKSLKFPPKVIFTTAHIDYAIEGYELDVLDYLVKPFSLPRFLKAISKYSAISPVRTDVKKEAEKGDDRDFIYVKSNKKHYKLKFDNILFIESLKDYIKIHTKDNQLLIKTTLSDFEQELSSLIFLRVHRSFIINTSHVTAHTSQDVELGKIEIPIGGSYKQKVFDFLK